MAGTAFPATLPTHPLAQSYREVMGKRTLASGVDEGPAKVRLLNTAKPSTIKAVYLFTGDQVETLESHYSSNAASSFNWTHPRTQTTVVARYIGEPVFTSASGGMWYATLEMEAPTT